MLSLRKRLLQGARSYGPVCMSDSPVVFEILALVGYTHMIIDHEHSPTDSSSGQQLLQAIDAASSLSSTLDDRRHRTEPIIRVPDQDPTYMKKILDSMRLPSGVLVPMVEDAQTAQNVVRATRYPIQESDNKKTSIDGIRGCAAPFIRGSAYGLNSNYMRQCQEDLLVMVQVETQKGVENIHEIAAIDGIDGIFLGPFDLSASIGKVGQFHDEQVQEIINEAEQAVLNSPCFLAGFKPSDRELKDMFENGYSLVCGSIDLGILRNAAMADVAEASNFIESE